MTIPQGDAREQILSAIEQHKRTGEMLQNALKVLSGEAVSVPRRGTWDVGTLVALWKLTEGLEGPREMLRLCSARPGEWVPFSEIAETVGIGYDQLRNEMSRFGREQNDSTISERPYETKQVPELLNRTGYRMPAPIAELMQRVLTEIGS